MKIKLHYSDDGHDVEMIKCGKSIDETVQRKIIDFFCVGVYDLKQSEKAIPNGANELIY